MNPSNKEYYKILSINNKMRVNADITYEIEKILKQAMVWRVRSNRSNLSMVLPQHLGHNQSSDKAVQFWVYSISSNIGYEKLPIS